MNEDDYPCIRPRKWISKEEAKEIWPDNSNKDKKWRYECYICGIKKLGSGEMTKQCNCLHSAPVKLDNV